jgi:hypothetical protein
MQIGRYQDAHLVCNADFQLNGVNFKKMVHSAPMHFVPVQETNEHIISLARVSVLRRTGKKA